MSDSHDSNSMVAPALLLLATVAGLAFANSSLAGQYFDLLNMKIQFLVGSASILDKSVLMLVNDGLMAVFFLFIGLELKREVVVGELSNFKAAILPIVAAVGGMVAPALIYLSVNPTGPQSAGWGVPMATDIAFALGVLAVLGSRVPSSLKILLAAVAIVDDLGAIIVIALFYTSQIHLMYLFLAGITFLIALGMNRTGVQKVSLYMLIGLPMWYFTLKSGVHATIAGVLLGALIPLAKKGKNTGKVITDILDGNSSALDSPAVFLEKSLYKWVGLLIIPIFAFANAGVSLGDAGFGLVGLGVALGLVVGKPLGIVGLMVIFKKFGLISLPKGTGFQHIVGLGCLAGIGFTMSLFIGGLAFDNPQMLLQAKLSILIASIISAFLGSALLLTAKK